MTLRRIAIAVAAICWAGFWAGAAAAHDTRPLFIEITEDNAGHVQLSWAAPQSLQAAQAPLVSLQGCAGVQTAGANRHLYGRSAYRCADGLSQASVAIAYPLYNPSISSLVRVTFATGETRSAVLDPSETIWRIPQHEDFASVAQTYLRIGVEHIIGGIDHLLFLAALLYIARTPRRVLITVTGFTLAHSLTIFLVALNIVQVSVPAVETVIALSIVFLAAEIARNNRETLAWRRPILVAAGFGLVHGAGFAAALSEIGLPQTEKLSALLFFNIGVEIGQLAIVLAVFCAGWAINAATSRAVPIDHRPVRLAFSYGLGIIAALWFIERFASALA